MPQKIIPQLHFYLNGSPIDYVTEFNFLGLTLDCNLNFKSHLKIIGTKISRVIGLLHKLKYIFPAYLLRMINSLILPHINYSLLAWGSNCHSIELLQKKAVRVVNFKIPLAHTEPILKNMNQLNYQICILSICLSYTTNCTGTSCHHISKILFHIMVHIIKIYEIIIYACQP